MDAALGRVFLLILSITGCLYLSSHVVAIIRDNVAAVDRAIPTGAAVSMDSVATASLYGIPIALIVMGLVYVLREQAGLPAKFAPEASFAFGILGGLAYEWQDPASGHSLLQGVVYGVVIGLIACGTYSTAKVKFASLLAAAGAPPGDTPPQ